ncbi:putative tRNA binding domain [Fragilaria crotonensis]|nr:putative tRNA binding domain [Fragilaria crotonensis]
MAVGSTSSAIVTNAALCTLTASASVLERDVVLQLVLHLASDRQVKQRILASNANAKKGTVPKNNNKDKDVLTLQQHVETSSGGGDSGGVVLTQRASILRALAGPFLHYALDFILLGGHGAASQNAGSQKSVVAMSSLASWMTVAHDVAKYVTANNAADDENFQTNLFQHLEQHLETRAFLIPSSQATLADMDLCIALLRLVNNNTTNAWDFTTTPNIVRWITTVHAQMTNLGAKQLPPLVAAVTKTTTSIPMPIFFYGTEQESFPSTTAPATTTSSGTKGQKQPSATTVAAPAPAPASVAAATGGGLTEEEKKAAADKRAAKKAASKKAAPTAPTATPEPAIDITALDIRIGKILKAWHHPESDKLFCEEVDVGEDKPRQIASGLRAFYQTEDLVDRYVLVLCNLKSRNLAGFPSHGMVLCASDDSHEKVEFVGPTSTASTTLPIPGERLLFGTLTGEPEPENKVAKKKIVEKVLPNLRTNANGLVVYTAADGQDHVAHTTTIPQGNLAAINLMANAHVA